MSIKKNVIMIWFWWIAHLEEKICHLNSMCCLIFFLPAVVYRTTVNEYKQTHLQIWLLSWNILILYFLPLCNLLNHLFFFVHLVCLFYFHLVGFETISNQNEEFRSVKHRLNVHRHLYIYNNLTFLLAF